MGELRATLAKKGASGRLGAYKVAMRVKVPRLMRPSRDLSSMGRGLGPRLSENLGERQQRYRLATTSKFP